MSLDLYDFVPLDTTLVKTIHDIHLDLEIIDACLTGSAASSILPHCPKDLNSRKIRSGCVQDLIFPVAYRVL